MAKTQLPVYLFTGFLESGKTKFIQETLEDKRFCTGERTLLLVCEEGEEEYEPDNFAQKNIFTRTVENENQLTGEYLKSLDRQLRPQRIIVEYNGMWLLDKLYAALPSHWLIAQEFCFADANTILNYNNNMRQLVYDKLKSCELVVFNRFPKGADIMPYHKLVRAVSRGTDIAYEAADGSINYDDIKDPLPFDLNAPIVEIGDRDYAEWYRDLGEEPDKYENKVFRFKALTLVRKKLPAGYIAPGRHIMTCCAEDIQFCPFICALNGINPPKDNSWQIITARLNFKYNKAYNGDGPVLTLMEMEPTNPPEEEVATFY